jgi:hypothetical protein
VSAPHLERVLALAAATAVPAMLAALPLRTVLRICDSWPRGPGARHSPAALAKRVRRWLAHGRGPWTSTCLTRALVLYTMLRQHGYGPRIVIGVDGARLRFDAHAWVELDGKAVEEPVEAVATFRELFVHAR